MCERLNRHVLLFLHSDALGMSPFADLRRGNLLSLGFHSEFAEMYT